MSGDYLYVQQAEPVDRGLTIYFVSVSVPLQLLVDVAFAEMPEDMDDSSTGDDSSSNFYSSPEHDHSRTRGSPSGAGSTASVEELEMTDDDEDLASPDYAPHHLGGHRPGMSGSFAHRDEYSRGKDRADNLRTPLLDKKRKRDPWNDTEPLGLSRPGLVERPSDSTIPMDYGETKHAPTESNAKRTKLAEAQESKSQVLSIASLNPAERAALCTASLPIEIWQHIFSFVPPVSLGRLLRVNRAFRSCLTDNSGELLKPRPVSHGVVNLLGADAVWSASRKLFCPGVPRPLRGFKELDMWRLIRGESCQFCGKTNLIKPSPDSVDPWEAGPGKDGVRVIWSFGVRSCGSCLSQRSQKVWVVVVIEDRTQTADLGTGNGLALLYDAAIVSPTSFVLYISHIIAQCGVIRCFAYFVYTSRYRDEEVLLHTAH